TTAPLLNSRNIPPGHAFSAGPRIPNPARWARGTPKSHRRAVVEIGHTNEGEEAGAEEDTARSSKAAGARRKNGRNGGRARNGKGNGDSGASRRDAEHEVALLAPDGKIRDIDLRRVLSAMRDLRDGDFQVRL